MDLMEYFRLGFLRRCRGGGGAGKGTFYVRLDIMEYFR